MTLMALAIDGLSSGLDTTSLIASLMKIEAIPQSQLKARLATTQGFVSALQSLNTKLAALADAGEASGKTEALRHFTATTGSDAATAIAGSGATEGSIDITVEAVARRQVLVTAEMTVWPASPPVLTIVDANGIHTEVTAASTSLDDVAKAVNSASAGVTAMKVASGTDPSSGATLYRLQFSATDSGTDGAVSIYRGSSADIAGGTATNILAEGGVETQAAQDAAITMWAGSTIARTVTSATGVFSDVLQDVDLTVSATTNSAFTLTVERDGTGAGESAKSLVSALQAALGYIATNSAVSTSGTGTGASVRGGLFTGDSAVRNLQQQLQRAAMDPIDGRSPAELGITITREGRIDFDSAVFTEALAAEPERVESAFAEIAQRISAVAVTASDKFTGTLSRKITGQESLASSMTSQIIEWDRRLDSRRFALERTYAALEVQLNSIQSQSAWLTSQLGALPKIERS